MKKIMIVLVLLCLSGCATSQHRDEPPYWSQVGEEIPPAEVLGRLPPERSLKIETKAGQAFQLLQWLWGIGSQTR